MDNALANPDMVALVYTSLRTIVAGCLVKKSPCRRQLDFSLCILGVNSYVCRNSTMRLLLGCRSVANFPSPFFIKPLLSQSRVWA